MKQLILITTLLFSLNAKSEVFKDFSLTDYHNNKNFNLSKEMKSKKVVINFWASWCTSCIEELPLLQELRNKYKDKAIFIAINVGEDKKKIKKFLKKYDFPYVILMDPDKAFTKSLGIDSIPQTFVLDHKRKIVFKGIRPPKDL